MASLLSALLLVSVPDAHAGTYVWQATDPSANPTQSPTFTGGSITFADGSPAQPYNTSSTGFDVPGPPFNVTQAAGTVQAAYTWQAAGPGDLPPQAVIVTEERSASWSYYNTAPPSAASCSDGLAGAGYSVQTPGSGGKVAFSVSGLQSSVAFAPVDLTQNWAYATLDAQVAVSPVTLTLSGTTLVSGGSYNILVGQGCTASLSGIPSGCTVSDYKWDIESTDGGSVVGGYVAQQARGMTISPASLYNPTIIFYDGIQDTVMVNVTATVTFPDKTTGSLSATAMVAVVKPTLSKPEFSLVGSDNFPQDPNDTSSQYGAVETYKGLQIIMPVGFTGGTGYVVQKVQSTMRVDMRRTGSQYYQQQKQFGSWMPIPAPCLDGDFPYPFASIWAATPNGSTPTADQTGSGIDTPAVLCAPPLISGDTGGMDWYASSGNDQFMVWIMYNPDPQSSSDIWVPLNTFTWGWSNQASLNTTTNTWSAPNFQPASGSNTSVPAGDWPTWTTWVQYSGTGYLAMRP